MSNILPVSIPAMKSVPAVKKAPNPIDKHVGARVRMRRILIGMSQEKLGDALSLTFQQVQKYEKGTNRIGASRLQQIGGILGVPVEFFFDGAPAVTVRWASATRAASATVPTRNMSRIFWPPVKECILTAPSSKSRIRKSGAASSNWLMLWPEMIWPYECPYRAKTKPFCL